jgi:hypothetical protein
MLLRPRRGQCARRWYSVRGRTGCADNPHHTFKKLAATRKDVEDDLKSYQLLDDRVIFLEGWF